MTLTKGTTAWRATGPYRPTNSSKSGLVVETREFLIVYSQTGDVEEADRQLRDGGLPQRSRETRRTIIEFIRRRLTNWHPPAWALADLASFAQDPMPEALQSALLLHVCRQDVLLYDLVQQVIDPQWRAGQLEIRSADVQSFLDLAEPTHAEVGRWSHSTRQKLASNCLTILRDYGLLQGRAHKQIVEPVIPRGVTVHLAKLLTAEGIPSAELPHHSDWQLWLWDPDRAMRAIGELGVGER